MNRVTSNRGINLIKGHESLRLKAYLDAVKKPTIGYGHTKGVSLGQTITEAKAIEFLREDVSDAERAVNRLQLNLTQNQYDALVSFIFNLGEPKFRGSTLFKKLTKNPNDSTIRNEFNKWIYGNVKGKMEVLPGLVRRRKEESDLYFEK